MAKVGTGSDGAPFGTWRCACEKVELKMNSCLGAPYYKNGDCFCGT